MQELKMLNESLLEYASRGSEQVQFVDENDNLRDTYKPPSLGSASMAKMDLGVTRKLTKKELAQDRPHEKFQKGLLALQKAKAESEALFDVLQLAFSVSVCLDAPLPNLAPFVQLESKAPRDLRAITPTRFGATPFAKSSASASAGTGAMPSSSHSRRGEKQEKHLPRKARERGKGGDEKGGNEPESENLAALAQYLMQPIFMRRCHCDPLLKKPAKGRDEALLALAQHQDEDLEIMLNGLGVDKYFRFIEPEPEPHPTPPRAAPDGDGDGDQLTAAAAGARVGVGVGVAALGTRDGRRLQQPAPPAN